MALLNPVYGILVPFLFIVTVPLALLAGITTTLAFAVLIVRIIIVYLDVVLSLIPQSLANLKWHRRYINHEPSPDLQSLQRRRRRRPSSSVSILSTGGSTTPISELGLGLAPSVGPGRDYEGIGGWRSGDDDEVWTTINSRLEFPDRRHHYRTPSGGATTPGDGGVLMMKERRRSPEKAAKTTSPNSSRARTPSVSRAVKGDSYFPLTMSPKMKKATV